MHPTSKSSPLRIALEPVITPVFRAWWRVNRSMTLGVRGLACDGEGRVVLVRHTYRQGWYLPGGGVERGETASEALTREMQEEAGVYPTDAPHLVGFYSNHQRFKNDHVVLFRVPEWRWGPANHDGEIAEVAAFAPDALPPEVTASTRARIREVLFDEPRAEHW